MFKVSVSVVMLAPAGTFCESIFKMFPRDGAFLCARKDVSVHVHVPYVSSFFFLSPARVRLFDIFGSRKGRC